jgi:3'(2'), 5'-bisphosphate nucleotidase
MTALLDRLLSIAFEAAALIREVYETPFVVNFKGPEDPVTVADVEANELICRRLSALYPGVPIVAEESAPDAFGGYQSAERIFFVDPLDGTAEFVNRNGEFVVMIGLVEGDVATAGVVVAPSTHTAWAGTLDEGSFRVAENGAREKIHVSGTTELADSRVVSSRSHRSPTLEHLLGLVGGRERVAVGSAGLKGAEIAMGGADVYVAPGHVGKRWDACAIDALVCGAGGRFTDEYGHPFDYRAQSLDNVRGLVATNGLLHGPVLDTLLQLRSALP